MQRYVAGQQQQHVGSWLGIVQQQHSTFYSSWLTQWSHTENMCRWKHCALMWLAMCSAGAGTVDSSCSARELQEGVTAQPSINAASEGALHTLDDHLCSVEVSEDALPGSGSCPMGLLLLLPLMSACHAHDTQLCTSLSDIDCSTEACRDLLQKDSIHLHENSCWKHMIGQGVHRLKVPFVYAIHCRQQAHRILLWITRYKSRLQQSFP